MLYNYIFVYKSISFKNCKIVSPSYLLNNEERPECIPCNSNFSLKHVLIDCVDVADNRQTFYHANSFS
jgi:hypothetical protein